MLADLNTGAAPRIAASTVRLSACALLAALVAASPTHAQSTPTQDDLRALIYYSVNGNSEAATAELRRLRAQFPDWTPPADPSAPAVLGPDAEAIERIYRAIAQKRIPEAQSAVEALRREYLDWTPPDDMTRLIDLEAAQADFVAAIGDGGADEALAIARREPAVRRCDRVNNVWLLAELLARQDRRAEALTAYRAVLVACSDYDVVKATLEKSSALQDSEWLRASFDAVRPRFADRSADLDALQARLLGGAALAQSAQAPSSPRPSATGAKAPARAAATPRTAIRKTPSGLPAHGDRRIRNVQRASAAENWAQCLQSSRDPKSLDVLYQRSWCVYGLGRPLESLVGFNAALLGGLDANATRDAAYGAALAYLSLGAVDDAAQVAASNPMFSPHRIEIESGILDQRGVAAYEAREYAAAIAFFDELERLQGRLRRDLAMLRGYAYKHLGKRASSHRLFRQLHLGVASERTEAALRGLADLN